MNHPKESAIIVVSGHKDTSEQFRIRIHRQGENA